MIHKFNVRVVNPRAMIENVYTGIDYDIALNVYTVQVYRQRRENFIEFYKDGVFHRSTIGRS